MRGGLWQHNTEQSTLPPWGRRKEPGALPGGERTWAEGPGLRSHSRLPGLRQAWRGWGCGEGGSGLYQPVCAPPWREAPLSPAGPLSTPCLCPGGPRSERVPWASWDGSAPGLPSLCRLLGAGVQPSLCPGSPLLGVQRPGPPPPRPPVPPARSGPAPPAPPAGGQDPPQTPLPSQGHRQEGPVRPLGRPSSRQLQGLPASPHRWPRLAASLRYELSPRGRVTEVVAC